MNVLRDWLSKPLGWFTFVLAEYVITIAVLRAVLPEQLSAIVGVVVLVLIVVGLFALNLWLRRRLAPPGHDTDRR